MEAAQENIKNGDPKEIFKPLKKKAQQQRERQQSHTGEWGKPMIGYVLNEFTNLSDEELLHVMRLKSDPPIKYTQK